MERLILKPPAIRVGHDIMHAGNAHMTIGTTKLGQKRKKFPIRH